MGLDQEDGRGVELAIGRDTKEHKKFSARTTRAKPSVMEYSVTGRLGGRAHGCDSFPGRVEPIRSESISQLSIIRFSVIQPTEGER